MIVSQQLSPPPVYGENHREISIKFKWFDVCCWQFSVLSEELVAIGQPRQFFIMTMKKAFKYFKTSHEIIRLAVIYYVRYPLSLRQIEDILHERGIDICHETIRFWWNRFGPIFVKEIRHHRAGYHSNWRWYIDEVFVKISGERMVLWRAVDHEGTVLESYVSKRRDRRAALKVLRKLLSKCGSAHEIVNDKLGSYGAALRDLGIRISIRPGNIRTIR
jgi:putative transposase